MPHISDERLIEINKEICKLGNERSRYKYAIQLIIDTYFPSVDSMKIIEKIKIWDDEIEDELKNLKNMP